MWFRFPGDAYAQWPQGDDVRSAEGAVWSDDRWSGPERTRAAAKAGARANVWRSAVIAEYLRRVDQVRFSAEWSCARDAGVWRSARVRDGEQKLISLAVPMLLLHGRYDMIFPAWLASDSANRIPLARAVVLDDAGHMAHIDQPAAWLNALAKFL